jgi:hypothetical protein
VFWTAAVYEDYKDESYLELTEGLRPLTHTCEFARSDFAKRLATLENFARLGYANLNAKIEEFEVRRSEARAKDIADYGPYDSDESPPYYVGAEEELGIESAPVYSARRLIGSFGLVYIVSALHMYVDALLEDVKLKAKRKLTKKEAKKKGTPDEGQDVIAGLRALSGSLKNRIADELFDLIKEIVAARHDFVHNDGRKKKAKRFVNSDGQILVTGAQLLEMIAALRNLSAFLTEECKPLSEEFSVWLRKLHKKTKSE